MEAMRSCIRGMLFVATISLLVESSRQQWALIKFHVHIVNDLPEGSPMEVHCKSADDDLGNHTVETQGEYVFTFREDVFMTTLFWCNVWWVSYDRHTSGDVFWPSDAFLGRCQNRECIWHAGDQGLEFINPYTNDTLFHYGWDCAH